MSQALSGLLISPSFFSVLSGHRGRWPLCGDANNATWAVLPLGGSSLPPEVVVTVALEDEGRLQGPS